MPLTSYVTKAQPVVARNLSDPETSQIILDANLLTGKFCPVRGIRVKGWQRRMSMQLTMKPYVTVGVALVGASVIAVAPIAPRADLHLPAVNLTASIDNPITVFTPVVNAAGDLIRETLQAEFADPFPILRQIFANQEYTVRQLLAAVPSFRSQRASMTAPEAAGTTEHTVASQRATGPEAVDRQ